MGMKCTCLLGLEPLLMDDRYVILYLMILLASPDSNSIIPAIHGKGNVQLKGKAPAALFFSDVTPGLG